jgi:hypothetical protein
VYGNGGLLTTIGDLLKWNANFTGHVVGDAAFVDELQQRATLPGERTHEYALGLYVDTYKSVREIDHSGATGRLLGAPGKISRSAGLGGCAL